MPNPSSIRDRLEADAWRRHPEFARRQADKCPSGLRRRPLRWQDRALLIVCAVLLLMLIIRVETAQAAPGEDGFYGIESIGEQGRYRALALDTDIRIDAAGLAARVHVTQVFRNEGPAWAEAVYRYPLPPGAAVDRLRVKAGNRVLEGEIREKTEARRQYQAARAGGATATLVEQQRPDQFETRLANIGPGETVRVTLSFLARIDYREANFSLRIPLTFTPRWGDPGDGAAALNFTTAGRLRENPAIEGAAGDGYRLTVEVDLRTGMNLASIESRYHDVDIHPSLGGYRVFLADPDTRSDRVFELNWTPDFGSAPESALSTWDDGEAVYALLMLAPPLAEAIAPRPREVVFVVDTSGSMEGASLEQARSALQQGLRFLGPDDRFNLIRFSSESHRLFDESAPVFPAYLDEAAEFIDSLRADGGTVIAPALGMALNLPEQEGLLRQVVFITDGSVGNEREILLGIGEELGDSRLFTVSIGSAPNIGFMRKSAEVGRGSHTHIGRPEEVAEQMAVLWRRIENPAIQNLCVDWGMEAEFYPEIIPDLYAGEPLWLYARLPHPPREVTVCGELEGRYWELESRVMPGSGGPGLATLWARSKVEALEDSRIFGADPAEIRVEALDVALEYGLLTPYTSLVAVDRTPSRPAGEELESGVIPGLLPAGSGMAAGFSRTSSGWLVQGVLSLLSLLVASGMLLYVPPSRARSAGGDHSPMTLSPP